MGGGVSSAIVTWNKAVGLLLNYQVCFPIGAKFSPCCYLTSSAGLESWNRTNTQSYLVDGLEPGPFPVCIVQICLYLLQNLNGIRLSPLSSGWGQREETTSGSGGILNHHLAAGQGHGKVERHPLLKTRDHVHRSGGWKEGCTVLCMAGPCCYQAWTACCFSHYDTIPMAVPGVQILWSQPANQNHPLIHRDLDRG